MENIGSLILSKLENIWYEVREIKRIYETPIWKLFYDKKRIDFFMI